MSDDELDQRLRGSLLGEQNDTSRIAAAVRKEMHSGIRRPLWTYAAAAAVLLAIAGALSYRAFLRTEAPPACVAAADDHHREIINGDPRPWLTNVADVQKLAESQGVPGSAIVALDNTGYKLERARLCFLGREIYVHLVYTRGRTEFSVYLHPRMAEPGIGSRVRRASSGAENLAYFETNRLIAIFVDEQSGNGALAFARAGAKVL